MCRALGGMGIGYLLKQFCDQSKIKPSSVFEGIVLAYAFLSVFIKQIAPTNYIFYVVVFTVLLFCFIQKGGKVSQFFEKPIFAYVSRYCLSVYLVQAIVIWDIYVPVSKMYPEILQQRFYTVFITLFLTCLLGIIAHHAIELPATRALKKWLG